MKTVLVIDDNETFRFILSEWLKSEGFFPLTAEDGLEGIRLARLRQPDVILCDVKMPTITGIDVLEQLQTDLDTSHIPFFFLTSEPRSNSRRLKHLGARGVISKSAEINELRQALTTIETKGETKELI